MQLFGNVISITGIPFLMFSAVKATLEVFYGAILDLAAKYEAAPIGAAY